METMGLELVAGRPFSQAHPSDLDAVILNETAVRQLGWASAAEAVGQRMGGLQPIIGVVKDFDVFSKHYEVRPVALRIVLDALDTVVIRLKEGGQAPLSFIEDQWKAFAPEQPFSFYFMEEGIDALYRKEQQLGRLVSGFSGLAIFIACLGLFGLAAFMADRRTKEIGIRKVFGATVPNIMVLLSKEVSVLVVVACMLAMPLAYGAMNRWLENFAYHVEISWWIFLLVGSLALVIAWLTVSYQSIRAALTNPVEALRYE